jgi:magnesium chelatase subunit D
MTPSLQASAAWADARLAATLCAIDPAGLAGIVLRAGAGPVRDLWLERMRDLWPPDAPWRRMPLNIPDARLLGGIDLVATLRTARPVAQPGLLAEAHGGVLVVAGVERMGAQLAARICAVMDARRIEVERDGVGAGAPAAFVTVGLDEGADDDAGPPAALLERLAFHLDLDHVSIRDVEDDSYARGDVPRAIAGLSRVEVTQEMIHALCGSAAGFGIRSLRAPLFALRAARALAALDGSTLVTEAHAVAGARLVYASRALQLPVAEEAPPPEESASPPPPNDPAEGEERRADRSDAPLEDVILAAVQAAMPAGLLARLQIAAAARGAAESGKSGAEQRGGQRGRPAGVRRGDPRRGTRLDVVETLRAAAPWQTIRRRLRSDLAGPAGSTAPFLEVRTDDFRVKRYIQRARTTTIFAVDASGSAALHRLGEAKGAVELLLGECYVRRDRVALVAFRGTAAEVLLPPTRSLVRAKRALAGLPGGGGTPLATGIDVAVALADALRGQGDSAVLIFLTDGRANIARDGRADRATAEAHAVAAARRVRSERHMAILVDTAPRPQPLAGQLAREMNARYVPLPNAGARGIDAALRQALDA